MTREQKLEAALRQMVHAVCGPTGLHEAVKFNTGMSYPWPALDLAEDAAMLALATPPDADTRVVSVEMLGLMIRTLNGVMGYEYSDNESVEKVANALRAIIEGKDQ